MFGEQAGSVPRLTQFPKKGDSTMKRTKKILVLLIGVVALMALMAIAASAACNDFYFDMYGETLNVGDKVYAVNEAWERQTFKENRSRSWSQHLEARGIITE